MAAPTAGRTGSARTADAPGTGHNASIRRHPVAWFAGIAYLLSWLVWSPWVLARNGVGLLPYTLDRPLVGLLLLLGTFGPTAAAIIVARAVTGSARSLLRAAGRVRTGPAAYAVALAAVPAFVAAAMLVGGERTDAATALVPALVGSLAYAVAGLLSGPLGEELGWRGFATPSLQRRLHPLAAALVVGLIWAGWHLPQVFTAEWDTPHETPADVLGFLVFTLAAAVVLAWVGNLGAGSVVPTILGHGAINATPMAVHLLAGRGVTMWPPTIGLLALAVAAAVCTRGRLGAERPSVR